MSQLQLCYIAFMKAANDMGMQDKWIIDEDSIHHMQKQEGLKHSIFGQVSILEQPIIKKLDQDKQNTLEQIQGKDVHPCLLGYFPYLTGCEPG
jgi:hypothetical protein